MRRRREAWKFFVLKTLNFDGGVRRPRDHADQLRSAAVAQRVEEGGGGEAEARKVQASGTSHPRDVELSERNASRLSECRENRRPRQETRPFSTDSRRNAPSDQPASLERTGDPVDCGRVGRATENGGAAEFLDRDNHRDPAGPCEAIRLSRLHPSDLVMDDQGTDSLDGIQVDDGPSTSSATVCADGEGSTEEVCPIPESVSEVEVEATASEEDSDLLKPPVLEPEEPLPNEADPSPHGDNPENTIVISSEDLAEAGLDMDNLNDLTNEQVAMLMEIAERRVQREMEAAQRSVESQQAMEEVVEEQYEGDGVQINNEALTMVITDDGSLKLTDACNQTFFFSAEQLGTMNIDVNNLTDESIQQIVQVAMPVIQVGKPREPTAEEHQALYDHDVNGVQPSGSGLKSGFVRASQLIGEQIEVRRNGKVATATIRYVRNGGAFKVQFDDGHFEWVTEDQIVIRTSRTHTDHEGYHNGSSAAVPRVVHASSMAGLKRAAAAAGGGCREVKRPNMEPNFCCPICENKVYQKEPAYIVIRIPACDSCTREKIIVLDDGAEGDDDRAVL